MAQGPESPHLAALPAHEALDAELRALYAALPVGVAFLGPDLRVLRVNGALARMTGRPAADPAGASLEQVFGPAAARLEPSLRRVIATRQSQEVRFSGPGAAGSAFEGTLFPVVDGGELLLGVGAVLQDVSARTDGELEQARLLRDALIARAHAEAAGVRADDAREEAEMRSGQIRRAHARLSLLAEAGRRMAESMEWETLLEAVVRSAVPAVADWASLTVVEPGDTLRVHAVAHADPERERLARELLERHPPDLAEPHGVARVVRTGEPSLTTDIEPEALRAAAVDDEHARLLASLDLRHVAMAPLTTPEGVIGVLTLVLGESGRRFDPDDLRLLTSLAGRASLHMRNVQLYRQRSHIAQTLQTSLLPHAVPEVPGLDIAVRYRPAGEQNLVGGDFYDLFRSGDGVWTAIIGDVAGKGAEAAAVTALARHTLRTASRLQDGPAENLALLNELLIEDGPSADSFCSVFYARLCPGGDGCQLRFANGGHPLPLRVRVDGTVEELLGGRGPLVGVVADGRFHEATALLAPGELLVAYTDGVTEVRPSDLAFGEAELRRTLAETAGAPAEAVASAVERRVMEIQDGHPRDDIALITVRALGRGAEA